MPKVHCPVAGSQLVWHTVHVSPHAGSPTQIPFAQVSLVVQRLPSSHAVPSGLLAHGGMVVVVVVASVVGVVTMVVDVVLAEPATTAARSSTQFSARPCTVSEVLVL
jgi:hypothetical protein